MSVKEMLKNKAIIMMEGNDVASGLKWALYSSSVVMMPVPTVTSWALEEMLQPWKVRRLFIVRQAVAGVLCCAQVQVILVL